MRNMMKRQHKKEEDPNKKVLTNTNGCIDNADNNIRNNPLKV